MYIYVLYVLEYVYMDDCIFMYIGFYAHILMVFVIFALYMLEHVCMCLCLYAYVIEYFYVCVLIGNVFGKGRCSQWACG